MYIYIYLYIYIYIYIARCEQKLFILLAVVFLMYLCIYICKYTDIYIYINIYMCVCVWVCVVCVCVHKSAQYYYIAFISVLLNGRIIRYKYIIVTNRFMCVITVFKLHNMEEDCLMLHLFDH